jgi:Arc/MetJ-type ribon-helix-helix transcriptional regulator
MTVDLPPELDQFFQKQLASGSYNTEDEFLVEAVRVLRSVRENGNGADDWFEEALEQFRAIISLKDGWDSNGGQAIDTAVVYCAQQFIYRIFKSGDSTKPHINPTRDGGIQFEWEVSEKCFELEFKTDGKIHYFFEDGSSGIEEGMLAESDPVDQALGFLRRL